MCTRMYIFNFNKEKEKEKKKQGKEQKKLKKKRSLGNVTGYDAIFCKFALCTCSSHEFLDQVMNFSWLFVWLSCSLRAMREEYLLYYNNIWSAQSQEQKIKGNH